MPKTLEEARKYCYGRTFGNKPNYKEGFCIESVSDGGRWPSFHQCSRKATVDGAWCKVHSPEYLAEKRRIEREKYETQSKASTRKWFFQSKGESFYDALQQIANGHNDARGFAEDVLKRAGKP